MAVEVDGAGVSRGIHEISDGGELDWIENGDGQVSGMLGGAAQELIVGGEQDIRLHGFGRGEMQRVEAFEAEWV